MGVSRNLVDARRPLASFPGASVQAQTRSQTAQWKGKKRDEGSGGKDGIVLSLNLVGDGTYTAVYTVDVAVGNDSQTYPLQVDTGSADLWVASTSCGSAPCTNNKPKLYNPSTSSTPTNLNFEIDYLSGQVEGPIVWDKVVLGGYEIDNQALAAATTVVNETLSSQFSGILGLALPLDSVISSLLTPVTSNSPDGAPLTSNLFGITPSSEAPDQLFYSLLLERPGSERVPSVLGIGRHPSNDLLKEGLTIDPKDVMYGGLLSESSGVHFWKVELRAISVYVDGMKKDVDIGKSVTGSVFPEAILDSGVPLIISTPTIANGIWGALGIGPAQDGNYYIDCATPLNMTVTLDDRREIPLHPLDLSAPSQSDPSSTTCVGLIQQYAQLASPTLGLGDVILGVPFLRNVYTVMAYEASNTQGIVGNGQSSNKRFSRRHAVKRADIKPQLGLLNITDPTTALNEFNQVRVLKQPLDSSNQNDVAKGGKKITVGLEVLFGLIGFVVLCAVLFGARWLMEKRRLKRGGSVKGPFVGGFKKRGREGRGDKKDVDVFALTEYHGLEQSRSHSIVPSEDTQQTLKNPGDEHDGSPKLDGTYDTAKTKVNEGEWSDSEFRFRRDSKQVDDRRASTSSSSDRHESDDPTWDPRNSQAWIDSYAMDQPALHGEWRPPSEISNLSHHVRPIHERTASSLSTLSAHSAHHHHHTPSSPLLVESSLDVIGLDFGDAAGMVGVGTARRGSVIDDALTDEMRRRQQRRLSSGSGGSLPPARPRPGRNPSGPRTSTTMSQVISADDIR